jgi:hypothetical protein
MSVARPWHGDELTDVRNREGLARPGDALHVADMLDKQTVVDSLADPCAVCWPKVPTVGRDNGAHHSLEDPTRRRFEDYRLSHHHSSRHRFLLGPGMASRAV